ncbi:L-ascorbate metabolism protein UlaG (beta-lactamase superfamily) [Arcanobacterium wilhelmae]|uniref:L-ascorbate metabolism protein UlaG (Beta-lactamase superfamily) n=1 Tax=Arcanobacterium wilhelmae TaxID=1803177 RepID=A0ABT9NBV8_9ACTO|nr:MBL fold metallo-hydrolase [Arcanobacterium wilhelmae]MDP9800970.1 L-ascorbate metabolism protein UlaG (beta-lactamase superfamily) [Arcanobacterium wilhelmae]
MKITRFTHAEVLVETKDVRLAIDPGEFGTIPDLTSVDAVLITHDHFDHISHEAVAKAVAAKPELPVYGPASLAETAEFAVRSVDDGDSFDVGGVRIDVVGHLQDTTSLDDPEILNVGFLIDGRLLHPGDALQPVAAEILLLPMETPWAKNVDRERALEANPPKYVIPIHDAPLGDLGVEFEMHTAEKLATRVGATAIPLHDGESVEL